MQLSVTEIALPPDATGPLALTADVLAVAANGRIALRSLPGGAPEGELRLPWPAHEIALSPSGRILAAAPRPPRKELLLYDRDGGDEWRVTNTGDAWLAGFALLEHEGDELLAVARDQRSVSLLATSRDAPELARFDGGGFEFDTLIGLPPASLASVGHATGESRDSLVLAHIPDGDGAREELDYAYRLIAGPAGAGAFVAFRDPEDAEEPDEEDEEPPESDLYGFRGLYVRAASGELLQRIEWDGPVNRGDRAFATDRWIALAMAGAVALVPRDEREVPVTHASRAAALDAAAGRVALLREPGELTLLDVPSADVG